MFMSQQELEKIASLAYIKLNEDSAGQLTKDVSAIMEFVEQLQRIDTKNIKPLLHPLDIHQRLREDAADSINHVQELAETAPAFEEGLYLVPKVIDTGN